MTVEAIDIDSGAALLRWVETGRDLARTALGAAGLPEQIVAALQDTPGRIIFLTRSDTGEWKMVRPIDRRGTSEPELPDAVVAAVDMFRTCRWLEENLERPNVPRHHFVAAGARLIDTRVRMLGEHWRTEDFRADQAARSKKAAEAKKKNAETRRAAHSSGGRKRSPRSLRRDKSGK